MENILIKSMQESLELGRFITQWKFKDTKIGMLSRGESLNFSKKMRDCSRKITNYATI